MKLMQLTQYLSVEEAEIIITFMDDIKALLLNHYGEEIRQLHRTRINDEKIDDILDDF